MTKLPNAACYLADDDLFVPFPHTERSIVRPSAPQRIIAAPPPPMFLHTLSEFNLIKTEIWH
jgi:hypothetical protein